MYLMGFGDRKKVSPSVYSRPVLSRDVEHEMAAEVKQFHYLKPDLKLNFSVVYRKTFGKKADSRIYPEIDNQSRHQAQYPFTEINNPLSGSNR